METGTTTFNDWLNRGKPEIFDPAQMNYCLQEAILLRDKKHIMELYEKDMIDWEAEESLYDEYEELVEQANNILYS